MVNEGKLYKAIDLLNSELQSTREDKRYMATVITSAYLGFTSIVVAFISLISELQTRIIFLIVDLVVFVLLFVILVITTRDSDKKEKELKEEILDLMKK